MSDEPDAVASGPSGPWAEHALAKPGAWADQPWEGDHVAKVGEKIFCFLGEATVGVKCGTRAEADEWLAEYRVGGAIPPDALREAIDTSYELVVATLPKSRRPTP